jgi:hypothetical protein
MKVGEKPSPCHAPASNHFILFNEKLNPSVIKNRPTAGLKLNFEYF